MPPLYHRVWQYLKYKVNHEEGSIPMRDGTSFRLLPGQHLTSVRSIAKGIGWYEGRSWKEPNPKTIDSILGWLEAKQMISISRGDGGRGYTLITLKNWSIYQHENTVMGNSQNDGWGNSQETEKTALYQHFQGINAIRGNSQETLQVTVDGYKQKELRINTITTDDGSVACAPESMNLPDELISEIPDSEPKSPILQVIDAYCELHNKISLRMKDEERTLIHSFLTSGIPPDFIISAMKTIYADKQQREGERFDPPSTFMYYKRAIKQAWSGALAQGSQTDAQVPALPSVAPGQGPEYRTRSTFQPQQPSGKVNYTPDETRQLLAEQEALKRRVEEERKRRLLASAGP